MQLARRLLSAGSLALALSAGGISVGLAGDYNDLVPNNTPVPFTPFTLPSMAATVSGATQFLTYDYDTSGPNRIDTPTSACLYYKVIGAVDVSTDCTTGNFVNPITFEQWKQAVKIGQYAVNGQKEDVAHFINQVDLNLTRDHHMISYGPTQLAGYVCNHAGPVPTADDTTGLFPTQPEIDALLKDIKRNQHLIACVAMEFSVDVVFTGSVPLVGMPFTKFWIFDQNGLLTSKVNLDGRGDKFVPGVCTACHGGKFSYETAGQFDPANSPKGDLGAHFLPFDMANFAFGSRVSDDHREAEIFKLNMNVYNTENTRTTPNSVGPQNASVASDSIVQLIKGWYGDVTTNNVAPTFNTSFTAPLWQDTLAHQQIYQDVIAHSCRTCHVAMDNVALDVNIPTAFAGEAQDPVCVTHLMPNSLVTFDRFWLSGQMTPPVPGQPAGAPQQPSLLKSLISPTTPCDPAP
jgi:hypothetical protein